MIGRIGSALLLVGTAACSGQIADAGGEPPSTRDTEAGDGRIEPGEILGGGDTARCAERQEPPPDQPRRLNIGELDTIVADVLDIEDAPFSAIGNDYGVTVGSLLGTSETFLASYLDVAYEVAGRFVARESPGADCAVPDDACVVEAVAPALAALLRRPLAEAQRTRVEARVREARMLGLPRDEGLIAGIAGVLLGPDFLLVGTDVEAAPGIYPLDRWAIAERLALTLWNSVPDGALREAASSGALETSEGILAQVERMLADSERGDRFFQRFIDTHFDLPSGLAVPPGLEGEADPGALAEDLRREAEAFLWHVFENDLPIHTLVQSDYTFLNDRLAEYYGLGAVGSATELRRTPTAGSARTGGLLTMGAVLAQEGDLIHRGVNVLQSFLCRPLMPPSPEVIAAASADLPEDATVRAEVAYRAENGACSGCHDVIDPIGAAFEIFDESGREHATYDDGESRVYSSPFGDARIEGTADVSALLADGAYAACLGKHVLGAVSFRDLAAAGSRVDCIAWELHQGDPDVGLRTLMMRAFTTETFRARVVE